MELLLFSLKKGIAILLLLLIISQLFVRVGIYVSWKLNQSYIAKYECVNRHNPRSCCKGKCQLNKRISNLEQSEQQNDKGNSLKIKLTEKEPFVLTDYKSICSPIQFSFQERNYKSYNNRYHFSISRFSFHPPNCIV